MKRFLLVAVATLLVAPIGFAYASFLSKSIPAAPEASKLIVREVPQEFPSRARMLGFNRIERIEIASVPTYRLAIPSEYSLGTAIDALRRLYPNAFIDMDGWVN